MRCPFKTMSQFPRYILKCENGLFHSTLVTLPNCLCFASYGSHSLNRESRFMSKLLKTNGPKKKFKVFEKSIPDLTFMGNKTKKYVNTRRISVLSKIFMQYISDILVTGDLKEDILEKGIHITKVEITPDFHYVNVFWTSQASIENIDDVLYNVSRKLHHELSQLRVIGTVPKIAFIKDSRWDKLIELEKKFDQLSIELKLKTDENDDEHCSLDENEFETCPIMINNVYGLDYDKIMKKIGCSISQKKHFPVKSKGNLSTPIQENS